MSQPYEALEGLSNLHGASKGISKRKERGVWLMAPVLAHSLLRKKVLNNDNKT